MTSLYLFWLFAKISLFTFGGGYAMIPLYQSELVGGGIITAEEFANMVALAQLTPGPVGLNAATYIGYKLDGFTGAAAGTLGVMAPSLVLMTIAAAFLAAFKENPVIKALLSGIRPATVGLVAAAVIYFADISIFTAPLNNLWTGKTADFGLDWRSCAVFAAVLLVQWKWKFNIFYVLAGAIVLSILLHLV